MSLYANFGVLGVIRDESAFDTYTVGRSYTLKVIDRKMSKGRAMQYVLKSSDNTLEIKITPDLLKKYINRGTFVCPEFVSYDSGVLRYSPNNKQVQADTLISAYVAQAKQKFAVLGIPFKADEFVVDEKGSIRLAVANQVVNGVYYVPPFISGFCDGCFSQLKDSLKVINRQNKIKDMSNAFAYCSRISNLDLTEFSTEGAELMDNMFYNLGGNVFCTIKGVEQFNMSRVRTTEFMFSNAAIKHELNLNTWNVSKVTSMRGMFADCSAFAVYCDKWNVSNVTDMRRTFAGMKNLKELNLSGWQVQKVTTMKEMFAYSPLTALNLDGWQTLSLTDTASMLAGCSLACPPVHHFDMSKVTVCAQMFSHNDALKQIRLYNWNTAFVQDISGMFSFCKNLHTVDLRRFDISSVTNISSMFLQCSSLKRVYTGRWRFRSPILMSTTFFGCTVLENTDMELWEVKGAVNCSGTFYGCAAIQELDLHNWNVRGCTEFVNMFEGCCRLTRLNLSGWSVEKAKLFNSMFARCYSLQELNLTGWKPVKAQETEKMFSECRNLKHIDIKGWNLHNVGNANSMFFACLKVEQLDISGMFNIKLVNTDYMFAKMPALKSLILDNNDFSRVRRAEGTFYEVPELKNISVIGLKGWVWLNRSITSFYDIGSRHLHLEYPMLIPNAKK